MILVKSILEVVPIYWTSLASLPMGTLDHIRNLCYNFLWCGCLDGASFHWCAWNNILARPKELGGWGFKDPLCFAKALAAIGVWRILKGEGLS